MPASNLLGLIDDIAGLLDDVSVMTKIAVKKTAGVLGDDLALNAQQVSGVNADRELPVVWAVAKGSLVNKAILVPAAILISLFIPWAIGPLLMLGGLYLCFEGCEKLAHKFFPTKETDRHRQEHLRAVGNHGIDLVAHEKQKIKGAIRTDFILSAEIVVLTLGTVSHSTLTVRIFTLVGISFLMTVGVYGLVAAIVRMDDLGRRLLLHKPPKRWRQKTGMAILRAAPILMKSLGVVGTAAMFMVGGGIMVHGFPALHHLVESVAGMVSPLPIAGPFLAWLFSLLAEAGVGGLAGLLVLLGYEAASRLGSRGRPGSNLP